MSWFVRHLPTQLKSMPIERFSFSKKESYFKFIFKKIIIGVFYIYIHRNLFVANWSFWRIEWIIGISFCTGFIVIKGWMIPFGQLPIVYQSVGQVRVWNGKPSVADHVSITWSDFRDSWLSIKGVIRDQDSWIIRSQNLAHIFYLFRRCDFIETIEHILGWLS